MINKIRRYIDHRQKNNPNRSVIEKEILLGSHEKKILHFVTFKDFHANVSNSIKKIKERLSITKGKLLINGNLRQTYISKIMILIIKDKCEFTIVVPDGYRLSKTKNFEKSNQIALILEPSSER